MARLFDAYVVADWTAAETKKLGDQSKALQYLTRALDLSPKDAQQIKSAILNLEKEDNAEEEDEL